MIKNRSLLFTNELESLQDKKGIRKSMDITFYQASCYLVTTVLTYRTFHNIFLYYKNRKQVYLLHFAFLQVSYGLYLLFFTKTINVADAGDALIWERLENTVLPIFGTFLILFVNGYRRIFSKDFVYLYILLNVLLSAVILTDPNSYHIGLARERKFPLLGIVIYETDQPLLVHYLYLSGILMILWILFKVIAQFFRNLFNNLFLFVGLVLFCANVFLDILVAMNLVPLPYTSHFSFLILIFSVDSFLTLNRSVREIRDELKQVLVSPKKNVFALASEKQNGETKSNKEESQPKISGVGSFVSEEDRIFIRTLGGLELERGGVRIPQTEISSKRKMLKLVKILLIRFEKGIHREELLELLWPGMTEKNALNSLHALCFRLRKIIGNPEALVFLEDRLFFRQDLVRTDFQLFEKHYEEGARALRKGETDLAIQEFRFARVFYRGDFFEFDLYFPESEIRREYVRKSLIGIFRFLCDKDLEKREMEELLEDSASWICMDDLDERAWRFHFEALLQLDRKNEALRKYEEFKKSLKKELGVEPESATLDLIDRIRSGSANRTSARFKDSVL
ncbi:bacterial transcriptional activator domain protein [Leptospira weilii serovar Ranarum str. ICFT]|uniref:Bacterial transcriptional activator domain protein n=2 Tax=Leptospira weilii TaxID=28184 RepID=N1WQT5_9LEPT|nr:bacterial transcriptional activator domain protein [Leptospira weilii serovar Ranarum str. ICFT]